MVSPRSAWSPSGFELVRVNGVKAPPWSLIEPAWKDGGEGRVLGLGPGVGGQRRAGRVGGLLGEVDGRFPFVRQRGCLGSPRADLGRLGTEGFGQRRSEHGRRRFRFVFLKALEADVRLRAR